MTIWNKIKTAWNNYWEEHQRKVNSGKGIYWCGTKRRK